jgi:hypothetical protein
LDMLSSGEAQRFSLLANHVSAAYYDA